MPWDRATLAQIAARVKVDIQGSLEGTAAFFRASFERAATAALTGVSHQLHGHLAWAARQLDPRTADAENVQKIHGEPFGVFLKDAVAAKLTLTITGSNGTIVPAATVWVRSDGARYTVDADGTIASGTLAAAITAEEAGAAGNTSNGTTLEIETPIAGVTSPATIAATTTTGTDIETPAAYLVRVLQRRQNPPRGGAPGDFERWVLEVAGVTRVWVFPRLEGAGTVSIYGVNDDSDPITLDAPKLTEIETYLDQPGRQPVTMDALLYTPTLEEVDFEINISPNTVSVQNAIKAELAALMLAVGNPGTYDKDTDAATGMTLLISKINEAISIATGEDDHELVAPAANVELAFGSLPVPGAYVWGDVT